MKFLAILKDSLREALDTWVFYVMMGFSLLAILFIGSIRETRMCRQKRKRGPNPSLAKDMNQRAVLSPCIHYII